MWQDADVIMYKCNYYKKKYMECMEKKVTPNYTKILYLKEWSYYKFFGLFFWIKGSYSQKHIFLLLL